MSSETELKKNVTPGRGPSKGGILTTLVIAVLLSGALIGAAIGVWVGLEKKQTPPPPLETLLLDMTKQLGLIENIPEVAQSMLTPKFSSQLVASLVTHLPPDVLKETLQIVFKFGAGFMLEMIKAMPEKQMREVGLVVGNIIGNSIKNTTKEELTGLVKEVIPPLNVTLNAFTEGFSINKDAPVEVYMQLAEAITLYFQESFKDPKFLDTYIGFMQNVLTPGVMFLGPVIVDVTVGLVFGPLFQGTQVAFNYTAEALRPVFGDKKSSQYWTFLQVASVSLQEWLTAVATETQKWAASSLSRVVLIVMTLFATILSPVLTKLGERDDVYSLAANNVLDTFRQVEELVPGIAQKFMISLLEREHIALNSCTYQNAAPPPIPLTPLPPTSTHLPSSPHLLHYSTPITYPPSGSSLIGDAEVSSSSHCQPLLMEETVLLPPCDGTPSLSSNRSSTSDFKEPIADSAAVTMPMNNDSNLPQPCAQPLTSPIAPPKFAQSHLADKIKDRSRSNSVVVAEGNIWKDEDIPVADLSPNMDAKLVDVENHCLLLCTQLKSFSRNIVNEDLLMGSIPNIVSAIKLLITSMSVALDQAPKICISDSQRLDLSTSRKALISSSRLLCVAIKEHLSVPDSSSIIDCSHNLGEIALQIQQIFNTTSGQTKFN